MEGTVYVLTNQAMKGLVKIGKTTRDVSLRLADLYTTGVPLPFDCVYAAKVKDVDETEKAFHEAFEPSRINTKREFFEIKPSQAIAVLKLMAIEDVTPTVQKEANSVDEEGTASGEYYKRKRRPTFNFLMMGLKEGDVLNFNRNDETCTVLNGRQVSYQGEAWFLSNLTNKLLNRTGPMHGAPYWSFDGRNLNDIYNETYKEYTFE